MAGLDKLKLYFSGSEMINNGALHNLANAIHQNGSIVEIAVELCKFKAVSDDGVEEIWGAI